MTLLRPLLHWTAVQVHTLRGEWDLADEWVPHGGAGGLDYAVMRMPALLARAQLAEARADYASVTRILAPVAGSELGAWVDEPGFWPGADVYANALVVEGRLEDADAFLSPHEQRAADRGQRSAIARPGYARGRLQGAH